MSFSNKPIDFDALLYALAQQTESLSESVQHSLTEIGQHLHKEQFDTARQLQIRKLISQSAPLEIAYKKALAEWDANYASQERTKNLNATFHRTSELDNLFISSVLPTSDWVVAAQKLTHSQRDQGIPSQFWDKTDRMAVMVAGGIALGSMVAQLPGAIIGGVVAAGYGWYIGFSKTKHSDKSTLIQLSSEEVAQPDRQLPLTSPDEVENLFWSREAHEYITKQSKKFDEMLPELIERYAGEYILFEDGRVIDTDIDEDMLLDRVWKTDFVKDRIAKYNSVFCHLVPSAEPYIEAVGNA
jgi:hypothetical protein